MDRHCELSEAIQHLAQQEWIASSQMLLAMTKSNILIRPRSILKWIVDAGALSLSAGCTPRGAQLPFPIRG
jgi:hypothetical protein